MFVVLTGLVFHLINVNHIYVFTMAKIILKDMEPSIQIETKMLHLSEGIRVRVGRSHQCQTILNSNGLLPTELEFVSYKHLYITFSNGQFLVRDSSTNGTYVNGFRLEKYHDYVLQPGDVIQLGYESFTSIMNLSIPTFCTKLMMPDDNDLEYFNHIQLEYNTPVQIYNTFPDFECRLEFLHDSVRERLEVLQVLDNAGGHTTYKIKQILGLVEMIKEKAVQMMKLIIGTSENFYEEYRLQQMDHVSHFMFCFACCSNYVLKKWFIDQEIKLFHLRWHFLADIEKIKTVLKFAPHIKKVDLEKKHELIHLSHGFVNAELDYYIMPFQCAPELIGQRTIFIQNGLCYMTLNDVVYGVANELKKSLARNLQIGQKNLRKICDDDRISSLIQVLRNKIDFQKFSIENSNNRRIKLSELEKLAEESFPLCMNELHFNLKKNSHLRNGGRFQYGLFLKGIGLTLQDSLKFWKYHFTKKMTAKEFMKNYEYHIKHSYGAVGKMASYPPQSCKKILEGVPSYGEYHGCPFKISQTDYILPSLNRNGIIGKEADMIFQTVSDGFPQLACKQYFELKHKSKLNESPYHPNKYFEESQKMKKSQMESSNPCCNQKYDW